MIVIDLVRDPKMRKHKFNIINISTVGLKRNEIQKFIEPILEKFNKINRDECMKIL